MNITNENELLNKWDNDMSPEAIASKLLHMQPDEYNLKLGTLWIEAAIISAEKEQIKKDIRLIKNK